MNIGPTPSQSGDSDGTIHVYQSGQNLIEIAISYGVSLDELCSLNQLTEQSMLFPGQRLKIPRSPAVSVQRPKPTSHTVKPGETLISIAAEYGLSVSDLQEINQLSETAMIFPGTVLNLVAQPKKPKLSSPSAPEHCLIHGYHKVKPGDQLNRIAAFHGVTTQALLSANNLGWNSVVPPGSKIVIPISHNALNCPNLVQLSETSRAIAEKLVELAKTIGLSDFAIVAALSLEMQRSGLLPDLGNRFLTEKLIQDLARFPDSQTLGVKGVLEAAGYLELAEGAALWEPSAWLWLHQIGSIGE